MKQIVGVVLASAVLTFAALSAEVRENFITSCEEGGSSYDFCTCVFGKVEKKYSQAQIDAIELKLRRGHADLGYSDFVKKSSKECDIALKSGKSLGALAVSEDAKEENAKRNYSVKDLSALESLGIDEEFAQGIISALFESPEYKNIFMADCAVEFRTYFGTKQAVSACECAYRKMVTGGSLEKLMSLIDQKGELNDSLALETFLPCLPKNYTPELEKFMMDSCTTVASKSVCTCIVQDIKKRFTLEELLRRTLKNPAFIQGYATGAALRCKDD
ncbi:MAG: hypothetical protein J6Z31_01530 [Fibrobacter sp.]|nr:hypothetical protein [Fibrobacter sp.]